MSGNFKVGEVLVGQKITTLTYFNGMERVVTGGCETREGFSLREKRYKKEPLYQAKWANGEKTLVRHMNLRRKQPPAGEQSVLDMFKLHTPSKEIA